jgi:hypothetical protein
LLTTIRLRTKLILKLIERMKRWLNGVLVLVALVGLLFAVQQGLVKQTLSGEYGILAAEVGYLESTGDDGVCVIALPTRDPMHFRWRIFVSASEKIYWKNRRRGGEEVGIPVDGPLSFIANVRFREGETGMLRVWWGFEQTATVVSVGGAELNELLAGRWADMKVEQLASDGRTVMKSGELTSLLRISMPEEMREEAQKVLSPQVSNLYVPEFYHLQLGIKKTMKGQNATGASRGGLSSD